ncbi:MAG: hydroxymethylbilane synthase [Synergistaceae bacterium]|nr:hydroxymethylbilane synthase [Synergistaceae bacterium]
MLTIRIGTRSSPLALAQVKVIADMIRASWPDAEIIPVPIRTSGDKNMAAFSSDPQGIKGMFTHEIEESLRCGEIDIAVHSLKDLPANIAPDLPIVAYSKRGDPRDALIGDCGVIGTSSARRRVQLAGLYPGSKIVPVRGNIGTRLRKLDEGEYSGLVLSAAGLERLGLSQRITRIFTVDEIVPSPGQGILACQGRSDRDYPYLECVDDEYAHFCAIAERSFSRCLGSGCNIPAGAYAEVDGEYMTLRGFFADGGRIKRAMLSGSRREAESIGMRLAEVIMS